MSQLYRVNIYDLYIFEFSYTISFTRIELSVGQIPFDWKSFRVHSHWIRCYNSRRRMALWENALIVEWASVLPLTMVFAISPMKARHFSITKTIAVRLWLFTLASLTYRECFENKFVASLHFIRRILSSLNYIKKRISDSHERRDISLSLSLCLRL